MDSQAKQFVVCWFSIIVFLSYYFLEFDKFIFSFQDIYNSQLNERYRDDSLTPLDLDPSLWLEAGWSDGPDRNKV